MINLEVLGLMSIWDIYVNALSTVNLVMSIGISVEACVHITHAFVTAKGSLRKRAETALVKMGNSVFR